MKIFRLGVPLISKSLSLFPASAPHSLQRLLWVDALRAAVGMWGREGETEEKEREEAKLKLIMLLPYRRCVRILLAISKV